MGKKPFTASKLQYILLFSSPFFAKFDEFSICRELALMVRYTADAANLGKYYKYSKKRRKALFKLHSTHFH